MRLRGSQWPPEGHRGLRMELGGTPGALASDPTLGTTLRLVWFSHFSPQGPLITKASGIALGTQFTFV